MVTVPHCALSNRSVCDGNHVLYSCGTVGGEMWSVGGGDMWSAVVQLVMETCGQMWYSWWLRHVVRCGTVGGGDMWSDVVQLVVETCGQMWYSW